MKSSDQFLEAFNNIDKYLRLEGKYDSHIPFSLKIKESNNKIIKNFKDELLTYSELRNAIVHSTKINEKVIAEPHEEIVDRILYIQGTLLNPKKVLPTFQFTVIGAQEDEYIDKILIKMREYSFSQFPVFNKDMTIKELITTNTISRWLSSKIDKNGMILLENVIVSDLLTDIEYKYNYKFISRNSTIFEAYDLFIEHSIKKGIHLDAIFITHSGNSSESLLGLITIEDISLEIKRMSK